MSDAPYKSLLRLIRSAAAPEPGMARITAALIAGALVHSVFAVAVLSMIWAMYFGMQRSFGTVAAPYVWLANTLLILQFPLLHSALLSKRGTQVVAKLVPGPHGGTLSTTTYAAIASLQLACLFLLWTPSGIVWWQATGTGLTALTVAYAAAWLLLIKASYDAGAEVQSGALGWMSLMANKKPVFPDMPTTGLFRIIRQPIYVAFALTLWLVPVWTPDQLLLALLLTAYCLAAPRLKERRFARRYGQRFAEYRAETPYIVPSLSPRRSDARAETK
ncbi:MAG: isoprenylcysteine carboxylmethyltransferase family protein [Roseobacter sp.]